MTDGRETEPLDPPGGVEVLEVIERAWSEYSGDVSVFASAAGALLVGRRIGWEGLRISMSTRTFSRYESILGIKWRAILPRRGPDSEMVRGIRLADSFKNLKFWQVIGSGQVPVSEARHVDRSKG